jgi:hypothetical protein
MDSRAAWDIKHWFSSSMVGSEKGCQGVHRSLLDGILWLIHQKAHSVVVILCGPDSTHLLATWILCADHDAKLAGIA